MLKVIKIVTFYAYFNTLNADKEFYRCICNTRKVLIFSIPVTFYDYQNPAQCSKCEIMLSLLSFLIVNLRWAIV